jgi:hypothetical protein
VEALSLFRGFFEPDFAVFLPRKTRNRKYDADRATVRDKLLQLKRELDPLLSSREIRLRGSVSDYWIIPKRRAEIVCLWLRYPEPEGNYVIPHLEVTLWRNEVFIGLAIPKRGRIYQANLVNYLKKNGLVFVKSVTRLPSHNGTFRIEGGKDFFEGDPRSVALTHILDLARSYFPGTHWVHVGYSFKRNDPRVGSSQLAKLAASIFSELYWLYGIVSKRARLGTAYARRSGTKLSSGISTLRPFEKKRANNYSRRIASYEMDLRKKEKSSKAHRRILNLLAATLEMQGYKCRDDPRSVDLVCDGRRGVPYLFEAKSCNKRSVRKQIRAGVAQLYEYRFFVLGRKKSKLFLVTEIKPPDHFCDYLMNDRKIGVLWLEEASLKTTKRTTAWLHPIRLN